MTQPCELPLVRYDVCEPETMKDVIHSLDSLRMIMDNMFNVLEKNVLSERFRLTKIHERLAICQSKVEAFKGSKRPTTVFSTAKFPGTDNFPLFVSNFQQIETSTLRCTCRDIEEGVQYLNANIRTSSVNNAQLADELQALLSRLHSYGSDIERVELVMEDEGLGPMPPMIQSVGSVLVFNSSTDPRKGYHTMDNLVSSGRPRATDEYVAGSKPLASAPASLLLGMVQPDLVALDLTFKPTRGTAAALALPTNLPLDFVADIQYSAATSQAPAPADHGFRNEHRNADSARAPASNPSAKERTKKPIVSDLTVRSTGPNSPTPPPPSALPSNLVLPTVVQNETYGLNRAPPPPPPVPIPLSSPVPAHASATAPPSLSASASAQVTHTDSLRAPTATIEVADRIALTDAEDASPPSSGPRPGFLDAIKGMGISSLRSSAAPRAVASTAPASTGPISMLDEMKERMRRRNSALTGKVDKEKQKRDLEIINAARENNIYNLSLPSHSSPPPSAPPHRDVPVLPVKSVPYAANTNLQTERDKDRGRASSDDSDNSSEDTYSVSEVSFDCSPSIPIPAPVPTVRTSPAVSMASSSHSAATIHKTNTQSPVAMKSALSHAHVPVPSVQALALSPAVTLVVPPPALPPPPPPSAPIGRREDTPPGEGGGGGGGGLLDATRSSAVSNMLYSAKQNQAVVSDGSDDDWDD